MAQCPTAARDFIEQFYYHAEPQPGMFAIGTPDSDSEIIAALSKHLPSEASVSIHFVRGFQGSPGQPPTGFIPDFHLNPPKSRQ
jgi:hypothetical protein